MKWIHLDFYFFVARAREQNQYYLCEIDQGIFEVYLRLLIKRFNFLIRRKFYLHEKEPHVFLALEVRSRFFIPLIILLSFFVKKPPFIMYTVWNFSAGDDRANGEGFLDVMNAMTTSYLFKRNSAKGLPHLIHCCLEFQTQSREKELKFYRRQLELYERVVSGKNE